MEVATTRAHCVNWHSDSYAGNPIGDLDSVMREICLVDDDHRSCATASHQCQIAFQARQVEVGIRRRHDEDDIDVCRQELRPALA